MPKIRGMIGIYHGYAETIIFIENYSDNVFISSYVLENSFKVFVNKFPNSQDKDLSGYINNKNNEIVVSLTYKEK